jgi:integrase
MGKHSGKHRTPTKFIQGIAIREVRPQYYVVDFQIDGRRTRKSFSVFEDAKLYAHSQRLELKNQGTASLSMGDQLRVEVNTLLKQLDGRATLTEAVDFWMEKHPVGILETWDQTAGRYIASMRKADRRESSLLDKELKFKILSDALRNPPTSTVSRSDVDAAVAGLASSRSWSIQTADKYSAAAATLLRFNAGEGRRMRTNVAAAPTIWDAATIATLLHTAEEVAPSIVPVLAVMAFAGLRPAEAMRLDWAAIKAEEIGLDAGITKTHRTRFVRIESNLKAWLSRYRSAGPLVQSEGHYRRERERVMAAAGITSWPHDVLRHTAATFLYARTGDVEDTCKQLGHFEGSDMFLRHYKGLTPHSDAVDAFWQIRPGVTQHR